MTGCGTSNSTGRTPNVLVTRFLHPDGIGEIEDYMPVGGTRRPPPDQLVRRVRVVRGRMPFRLECRPAFDYARGASRDAPERARRPLRRPGPEPRPRLHGAARAATAAGVVADFTLGEGESTAFVLRLLDPDARPGHCPGTGEAEDLFRETVAYWRRWLVEVHLPRPLAGDRPPLGPRRSSS